MDFLIQNFTCGKVPYIFISCNHAKFALHESIKELGSVDEILKYKNLSIVFIGGLFISCSLVYTLQNVKQVITLVTLKFLDEQ